MACADLYIRESALELLKVSLVEVEVYRLAIFSKRHLPQNVKLAVKCDPKPREALILLSASHPVLVLGFEMSQ